MTFQLPIPAMTSTGDRDKPNRNHLLYEFRLNYTSDRYAETSEWLFQLARHWALWQSPAIGTFPLDYRDPSGEVSRDISEETGEDSTFWAIEDVLTAVRLASTDPHAIERQIVHATRVLTRLHGALESSEHAY